VHLRAGPYARQVSSSEEILYSSRLNNRDNEETENGGPTRRDEGGDRGQGERGHVLRGAPRRPSSRQGGIHVWRGSTVEGHGIDNA
jgi:hypothetical protein